MYMKCQMCVSGVWGWYGGGMVFGNKSNQLFQGMIQAYKHPIELNK